MKNVVMVKLSEIKEDFNPRTDFSSVPELAKSIESVGLLQPIVVQKNGEGYKIVDGACRFRALKSLDQKETQVVVIDAKTAEEAQMAANLMRADLNVLERARGYERMIRLFPAKYNVAGVAKTFGEKKQAVERLVSVAKRIPAALDAKLGPMVGSLGFEDLEMVAQLPLGGVMEGVVNALSPNNPRFYEAIRKVAKELDWQCDALTTGKLVAAGMAFVVKNKNGGETAYTTDEASFKEAKDAYEKKHARQYGASDKAGREKVKEKSEKQKAADRAARKKAKDAKEAAIKALPVMLKKFLGAKPKVASIEALGLELCERHLKSESSREILAAFGVKKSDVEKIGYMGLQKRVWKEIQPMCGTAESMAQLCAFLNIKEWDGAGSHEENWVNGIKKL